MPHIMCDYTVVLIMPNIMVEYSYKCVRYHDGLEL